LNSKQVNGSPTRQREPMSRRRGKKRAKEEAWTGGEKKMECGISWRRTKKHGQIGLLSKGETVSERMPERKIGRREGGSPSLTIDRRPKARLQTQNGFVCGIGTGEVPGQYNVQERVARGGG